MSLSPEKAAMLHETVGQLCNGELDAAGYDRLQRLVADDVEAQKFYVRYLDLHDALRECASRLDELESVVAEADEDGAAPLSRLSVLGWPALATSLAAVSAAVIAVAVWWGRPQDNDNLLVQTPPPGESLDDHGFEYSLPELGSVRLDSGTTRLRLPNIGHVVVDGPAEFDLVGPRRARLSRGRIKMRITEPMGRGFVVETPHGEITDLGTEFAIDASDDRQTGLIVFEGAVDLRLAETDAAQMSRVERIVGGEGVSFDGGGQFARISSIVTGSVATFVRGDPTNADAVTPTIIDVRDNFRPSETRCYYEIVAQGFREDALAYVDRPAHEWNGATAAGLPEYLVGADYVKPFNDDKYRRGIEIWVTVSRPATLYVLYDDRLPVPEWLSQSFYDTGDDIAMDLGPAPKQHPTRTDWIVGVGPGREVDSRYSVYAQLVLEPSVVRLGPNAMGGNSSMYGIAAVPLDEPASDGADDFDKLGLAGGL